MSAHVGSSVTSFNFLRRRSKNMAAYIQSILQFKQILKGQTYHTLWRWYINTTTTILDIIHRPGFNFKKRFGDKTLTPKRHVF
jgi:hypothetical protein